MSNNKQTAVDWLIDWMKNNQYFIGNDLLQAIKQAKEMEKQQIIESYRLRHIFHDSNDSDSPEEYYNTEYGKQ